MSMSKKKRLKKIAVVFVVCMLLASMFAVNVSAASWGRWLLSYSNSNTSAGDKDNNSNAWASYTSGDLTSIRAACYGSGFWGSENCTANSNMYVIIDLGGSQYIPTQVQTKGYTKAFISFSTTASGVSGYAQGSYLLTA